MIRAGGELNSKLSRRIFLAGLVYNYSDEEFSILVVALLYLLRKKLARVYCLCCFFLDVPMAFYPHIHCRISMIFLNDSEKEKEKNSTSYVDPIRCAEIVRKTKKAGRKRGKRQSQSSSSSSSYPERSSIIKSETIE